MDLIVTHYGAIMKIIGLCETQIDHFNEKSHD